MRRRGGPGVSVRKGVCSGAPCIAGTRVMTRLVFRLFMSGEPVEALTRYFCTTLTVEQVEAAIRYETRMRR